MVINEQLVFFNFFFPSSSSIYRNKKKQRYTYVHISKTKTYSIQCFICSLLESIMLFSQPNINITKDDFNRFEFGTLYIFVLGLRYRHLIETVQPPNLWQPTDTFMSGIQRPYPATTIYPNESIDLAASHQFQPTNSFYPAQKPHQSPSETAFPPLFTYVSPSFNHHLTSTVDDNSLLIQNPSLT